MELFTIFLFFGLISTGLQQPTFFRNTYKGLRGITAIADRSSGTEKIRAVYFHDQTVAVVDLDGSNQLQKCDLIEVYEPDEAAEVLKNLSSQVMPQQVSFGEMTTLMHQCEVLDAIREEIPSTVLNTSSRESSQGINPLTLLSGILPGTKWCGTGDIAENYHDLGKESRIDRCCRSHDLCPVKVRAHKTRYNLTNYSIYTKSHCFCDEMLYQCLKDSYHPTADLMGRIYFNFVRAPCVEDATNSHEGSGRRFISAKMSY